MNDQKNKTAVNSQVWFDSQVRGTNKHMHSKTEGGGKNTYRQLSDGAHVSCKMSGVQGPVFEEREKKKSQSFHLGDASRVQQKKESQRLSCQ